MSAYFFVIQLLKLTFRSLFLDSWPTSPDSVRKQRGLLLTTFASERGRQRTRWGEVPRPPPPCGQGPVGSEGLPKAVGQFPRLSVTLNGKSSWEHNHICLFLLTYGFYMCVANTLCMLKILNIKTLGGWNLKSSSRTPLFVFLRRMPWITMCTPSMYIPLFKNH